MGTTNRRPSTTHRRRPMVFTGAALVSLALIAGACSKKDDGNDQSVGTTKETTATTTAASTATSSSSEATTPASSSGTTGGSTAGSTVDTGGGTATTGGTDTSSPATDSVPPSDIADVTPGGKLVVSGEAEVANAWTPAAMQCDSYCQERARSFFDPVAAFGSDEKVHPYLAKSIEPNADFTQWTITLRDGISFTDGTPVDADAVIYNLQETGTSLLIAKALNDVAKIPDPSGATNSDGTAKMILDITKTDDKTFTIILGKDGDPSKPLAWPGFAAALTTQWGLIASPKWLADAAADPSKASMPIGSGPFIVQSYTPHDTLVVKKNPNYWQKDANGVQLPYLDEIDFKVIEDSQTAEEGLQNGELDIFSTSSAQVIKDFRDEAADFPMTEQTKYVETNYILIDLAKPGPTSDARVRCALSKAIDRQELIDLTEGGITQIANGLFSPGQEGHLDDNGFDPKQDIAGAKALIADYQKDHPGDITVEYGHTATAIGDQEAELLKGYWSAIGVNTTVDVVPQDVFITNALFGVPTFFMYGWRNNAGLTVDQQNYWWNSVSGPPDGSLALNFGRINDPMIDSLLADARSNTDAAARQKDAEDINRQMAKECYQIPVDYTLWGTPHSPKVKGLGETVLPDGSAARDGAGFSGQFWVNSLWIDSNS
ncbi:MAG: putative transporter substrate-binding protein [Ilumatobacteraceae bacterium]|nr:putative transporter substrate-binding protein [Ilumatobacteraceae bacterium]